MEATRSPQRGHVTLHGGNSATQVGLGNIIRRQQGRPDVAMKRYVEAIGLPDWLNVTLHSGKTAIRLA